MIMKLLCWLRIQDYTLVWSFKLVTSFAWWRDFKEFQ